MSHQSGEVITGRRGNYEASFCDFVLSDIASTLEMVETKYGTENVSTDCHRHEGLKWPLARYEHG